MGSDIALQHEKLRPDFPLLHTQISAAAVASCRARILDRCSCYTPSFMIVVFTVSNIDIWKECILPLSYFISM